MKKKLYDTATKHFFLQFSLNEFANGTCNFLSPLFDTKYMKIFFYQDLYSLKYFYIHQKKLESKITKLSPCVFEYTIYYLDTQLISKGYKKYIILSSSNRRMLWTIYTAKFWQ